MGIEVFIWPGLVLTVPLLLLNLGLLITRKRTRPYLWFVLVTPTLFALSGAGEGPLKSQVTRFATIFTLSWAIVALAAFVIWLVISAFAREGSEHGQ